VFVPPYTEAKDGRNAVLRFYHAFNRRDLEAMMAEMAEDVYYEDLVYDAPFVGAKALREYLEKVTRRNPRLHAISASPRTVSPTSLLLLPNSSPTVPRHSGRLAVRSR
jgi:ketosteroid isomerase-like protein